MRGNRLPLALPALSNRLTTSADLARWLAVQGPRMHVWPDPGVGIPISMTNKRHARLLEQCGGGYDGLRRWRGQSSRMPAMRQRDRRVV
jgi:hypothetical protein